MAKSPKFFFADHGLSAYLLGIYSANYETSIYRGALWENIVFSELLKTTGAIPGRDIFYYRDQNGVELDFIFETPSVRYLIEAKASERVDERKLNFRKVSSLFKDKPVKNVLMSNVQEKSIVKLKDYDIVNPILSDYFSF